MKKIIATGVRTELSIETEGSAAAIIRALREMRGADRKPRFTTFKVVDDES